MKPAEISADQVIDIKTQLSDPLGVFKGAPDVGYNGGPGGNSVQKQGATVDIPS